MRIEDNHIQSVSRSKDRRIIRQSTQLVDCLLDRSTFRFRPELQWRHPRMSFKIAGKEGGVGEVELFGKLGDGERGRFEQHLRFPHGEVGYPVSRHMSGNLADHFSGLVE